MAEMMYRLVLRANFEGAEEIQRATAELDKLKMSNATVTVQATQAGAAAKSSYEGIARSVMSLGFMFNMLESAMMRSTMAAMLVDSAQSRYNTTVEKYGVNSAEAKKAAKELETQMNYMNMATTRANVSMGLFGMTLVMQSGLLNATTRAQIAHTAATVAHTAVEQASNAVKVVRNALDAFWVALHQPWMLALAIAGTAAAVGATAYAINAWQTAPSPQQNPPSREQINVTVTDEDIIKDYMRRVGGNSIKSTG